MRTAFVDTLCRIAEEDDRIWLLTGDLGFSVLERFAQRFPDRFVNAGVAEQNMTGLAAGLGATGKVVFTYSIANFPTLRCLEQIRNDVCYHQVAVKVVAVGGGLAYGSAGYSHHAVEDLAIMATLPNMAVFAPGDPVEARLVTQAAVQHGGPCYLRLGKAGEPLIHQQPPVFEFGKAITVRDGGDVAILSTGGMLGAAVRAADILATRGISSLVLSLPTLVPFDEAGVVAAGRRTGRMITVEEHGPGALADLVAMTLALHAVQTRFSPLRLPREACTVAGSRSELLATYGLSMQAIINAVVHSESDCDDK